ncbi:hypothetical protein [Xanthocytophaga agilis]|uniref:Nickel/cobalt efflux system n=1 Tax=Xanthocytophaga agilis TaxID=3048010 RepID=A0AAE3UE55_9BACT|nr:hypothetical protein [Xanthocytophaga agilis]MDJ1499038.1 hypothetical protein [Xanthocytophaga agilis]
MLEITGNHVSGLLLLFVLGLRHGLDPDHITVIDGFTYRLHETKSRWARWVGTLFTFGHGLMVTGIALFLSLLRNSFEVPESLNLLIEWVPLIMLVIIGISNVITLTQKQEVKTVSLRKWLLPTSLTSHLNPFSIILTGIIFGFIFDTSTQIAAFGYAVSASDQWVYAVIGGCVFSGGLMLTGTFDSLYLSKLLQKFDQKRIRNHRFKLNVLITFMCFAIPAYKLSCMVNPALELDDFQNNVVGLVFIGLIALLYIDLYIRYKIHSRTAH